MKNGILVKPIMVSSFTDESTQVSNSSQKTAINFENTLVSTVTQPFKGIIEEFSSEIGEVEVSYCCIYLFCRSKNQTKTAFSQAPKEIRQIQQNSSYAYRHDDARKIL